MKLLNKGLLFIGRFEEILEGGAARGTVIELLLHTLLLSLNLLDHAEDVVAGDKGVSHSLYIRHLALEPVENRAERVLQHFTHKDKVLCQLILLATNYHARHRCHRLLWPVLQVSERPLLILAKTAEDLALVDHGIILCLHQRHYSFLDILEPYEHLLEELIELLELLISLDSRHSLTCLSDLLV